MKYLYSVIRFTPDPIRGESVNLGVIVGSDDTGEWIVQSVQNASRARRLEENNESLPFVIAELERLSYAADISSGISDAQSNDTRFTKIDESWLTTHAAESQNIIQFTKPKPVLAGDIQSAVDMIWPLFILEPTASRRADVTKTKMHSQLRSHLRRVSLGSDQFKESATVSAKGSSTKVDFAFHNGVVKDITQCYSFQIQDKLQVLNEAKSWAWTMRGIRQSGGVVKADGKRITIDKSVPITVVYAARESDIQNEVVEEALDVFKDDDVEADVKPFEQAAEVMDKAIARLEH